ncbi:MAG TPA: thioredoxin domain-containing protein, partial [Acidobacteriota bacterium]|nr:thioredoxin domain-containing protein [Acidobacteriota bacterium]
MSKRNNPVVKAVLFSFFLIPWTCFLWAQKPAEQGSGIVATFNGTPITEAELRRAAASDLDNLGLQAQRMSVSLAQAEHKIYEANLTRILQDKLFEAESSKQGMSKEAFLEKELQGKVRDPLPAEIAAFYEQNKARLNKPLEQATAQIQQYLKTENRNRALGDLAARLKVEYAVSTSLPPLRLKVQTEGSPARGPEGAAVTLVEFSDFQCPYCLQLNKTLEEVLAKYGSDVRLVYRQLPL